MSSKKVRIDVPYAVLFTVTVFFAVNKKPRIFGDFCSAPGAVDMFLHGKW
jgi:hypothetical protein